MPLQYALTQINLGSVYGSLAHVKGKGENCRKAIMAFREALKVFTENDYPVLFQTVRGNLASALEFCRDELREEDVAFLAGLRKINPPVTEK